MWCDFFLWWKRGGGEVFAGAGGRSNGTKGPTVDNQGGENLSSFFCFFISKNLFFAFYTRVPVLF